MSCDLGHRLRWGQLLSARLTTGASPAPSARIDFMMEKHTRRDFLIAASVATLAAAASPSLFASAGRQRVFVSCNAPDGILAFDWDPVTAELIPAGVEAKLNNVEWITFSADHQSLFAAAAADGFNSKPTGEVASYRVVNGELRSEEHTSELQS